MKLHEVVLPTDRWWVKVVSPVDITKGIDTDAYGEVVIDHPGWAKGPRRHKDFLFKLANSGFLPLGIDTRWGYSDRLRPQTSVLSQHMRTSEYNPYFEVDDRIKNRLDFRRPTVLLDVCERLGVGERSYVGHSEGGRIVTLAALADSRNTKKLIVVNGSGTGDSSSGVKRLLLSNVNQIKSLSNGEKDVLEASYSALGSVAYALTHLRRTIAEKQVIQSTSTWEIFDQLEYKDVDVTVLHAVDDELISYQDSFESSLSRPWIDFEPTGGNHSNFYDSAVQSLIIQALNN